MTCRPEPMQKYDKFLIKVFRKFMATKVEKLLIRIHLEQKENDALRDRIDGLELSLRPAAHERKVLKTKITSLEKKLLTQHAADPGLSARQEEGLHQIKKELFDILDDSV